MGKGGAAIRGGKKGRLRVDNRGYIGGGKGGPGTDGGDAIHIGDGPDVTIINNGVIAGGDAGQNVPAFTERIVHFNFPSEQRIHEQLDSKGLKVAWVNESRVKQVMSEGWWLFEFHTENGPPVRYRLKNSVGEDQLLMFRKK